MRRPSGLMTDAPKPAAPRFEATVPTDYLELYGLSRAPFGVASEGEGYILFAPHRRIFELLIDHMVNGSGLVLLHGEGGVGKTEMLGATGNVAGTSGVRTIKVTRPPNGRVDLARLVSALLSQNDPNLSASDMIRTILRPPRKAVLIDDIDLLPPDCVHLLLRLLRPSTEQDGIAIVAASTAEIGADAARPEFAELARLARASVRLPRIGLADARQYIERSLWIAGGTTRRLITPDALKLVLARSGGLPGSINQQMEAALTAGFARGDSRITAKTIAATARRPGSLPPKPKGPATWVFPWIGFGLLAIGASAFLYKASADWHERPMLAAPSPAFVQLRRPLPAAAPRKAETPPPALSQSEKPSETLSPDIMAALMKRGEQFISLGDVAAARLLFQRAAEAGNARAAIAMGRTYDPNYIVVGSAAGEKPDAAQATAWYRKAAALGDTQAEDLLKRIDVQPSGADR